MKNSLTIFLLIFALATAAAPSAGAAETKGITAIGVKVGASLANIFGEDVVDQEFKFGLAAGGFLTYSLGRRVALQPELLFVRKGSRYESTLFGDYKEAMDFNYMEIPLFAKYKILHAPLPVYVFAGPALAFRLSAKVKYEWEGISEEEEIEDMKTTDLGLAFGADTEFKVSRSGRLTLDLRYTLGLANIGEDRDSVKNGAFLLLVGWTF
ncbi:MAG: PorT family protein [Candidatus Aminicenantes bacterium]|nr:PorT family protein [Candidatus Aminicenantes bacterium]